MPRAVEAVLRAGLARRPERRPRSAVAFAEALAAAARATGPIAAGPGRARRPVIRGAIAAALLAAATVAIAAARDPAHLDDPGRTTGAVPAALAAPAVTPAPATEAAPPAAAPPAARRTVRLVVRPATARAFLDGEAVTGDALVLAPGRHQLRVTAPGYQPVSRAIETDQLGEQLSLRLVPRAAPRQTDLRTLLEK
jgi:hypothetical protein